MLCRRGCDCLPCLSAFLTEVRPPSWRWAHPPEHDALQSAVQAATAGQLPPGLSSSGLAHLLAFDRQVALAATQSAEPRPTRPGCNLARILSAPRGLDLDLRAVQALYLRRLMTQGPRQPRSAKPLNSNTTGKCSCCLALCSQTRGGGSQHRRRKSVCTTATMCKPCRIPRLLPICHAICVRQSI